MKYGFTISEFAKLRDININSLRYYEKIGVLKPAYTDPNTGYRYYTPDQLSVLDMILLCLSLDIPLKQLSEYKDENSYLLNDKLYETGKEVAKDLGQLKSVLGKAHNVKEFYESHYKDEITDGIFDMANPSSKLTSSSFK